MSLWHFGQTQSYLSWVVSALMLLPAASALGQARLGNHAPALSGKVVDQDGKPIPYAHLYEKGTGVATVTSSRGEFAFATVAPGNRGTLAIRRIGYRPLDTTLVVEESPHPGVELVLHPIASQLDTITIRATGSDYDDYLDRSGFYRRMSHKVDGTFLSRREIEKRNATEMSAVLRNVAGVRVVSRGGRGGKNNFVLGRGGICALGLVVDGRRMEVSVPPREAFQPRITAIVGGRSTSATETKRAGDATMDELIPPDMVSGIEVYPSAASVPNQFVHHVDGCGLVVVWTNYRR